MRFGFFGNLAREIETSVVHGEQYAFNGELGVEVLLHEAQGVEQFAHAFKRVKFALYGDEYRVGCRQRVEREQSQCGGAVDDDEVVGFARLQEGIFEALFARDDGDHFHFGAREANVRGRDAEKGQRSLW